MQCWCDEFCLDDVKAARAQHGLSVCWRVDDWGEFLSLLDNRFTSYQEQTLRLREAKGFDDF